MASGRAWVIRLVLGGVVLTGAAVAALATRGGEAPSADAKGPPPPAPVTVQPITQTELVVERRYLGEVRAIADAALTVGESGRVSEITVREGDRVEAGQLLLELDDRLARAQLGQARATRKSIEVEKKYAKERVKIFERLAEADAGSVGETEKQLTEAQALAARGQAAKASVHAEAERVQRHRIVAPFAGVVAQRHVDPGDWLDPGQPAIDLVTDDRVEVQVRVPPRLLDQRDDIVDVQIADRLGGDEERKTPGALVAVVDALDRKTRTALVRVMPQQAPGWLRPGGTATVAFSLVRRGGFVVSRDALVYGIHNTRVVRVVEGKAEHTEVEILDEQGNQALVRGEGLAKGDRLVVRGNERLRPGQAVAAAPASAAPSASAAPASSSAP
jgi:RND family efflux transporter MFP subunit